MLWEMRDIINCPFQGRFSSSRTGRGSHCMNHMRGHIFFLIYVVVSKITFSSHICMYPQKNL